MHVWLAMDTYPAPEGGEEYLNRVTMQTTEFGPFDFPPGKRGNYFETREAEVDEETYRRLLVGELTSEEQDALHRDAWNQTEGEKWSRP